MQTTESTIKIVENIDLTIGLMMISKASTISYTYNINHKHFSSIDCKRQHQPQNEIDSRASYSLPNSNFKLQR